MVNKRTLTKKNLRVTDTLKSNIEVEMHKDRHFTILQQF